MIFKRPSDNEDWQIINSPWKNFKNFLIKSNYNFRFFVYRYKWLRCSKTKENRGFPLEVMLEASNLCNLRCEMCFQSKTDVPKLSGKNIMEVGLFKKIVDECVANDSYSIKLSWRGEPLINENLVEMVEYAKRNGIMELVFLTNGMLLTPEISGKLIEYGLDILVISIDGITKNTYEKIRVGADFETVVGNVESLLEIKKRTKAKKPFIRVQYTQSESNMAETEQFVDHWKDKVNEVTVSYYQDFDSVIAGKKQPRFNDMKKRISCAYPWLRLVIVPDGRVTICACDVMLRSVVGNVNDNTIKEIWNSKEMETIRKHHLEGNLDNVDVCKYCNAANTYRSE